jgi:hypothetical protein
VNRPEELSGLSDEQIAAAFAFVDKITLDVCEYAKDCDHCPIVVSCHTYKRCPSADEALNLLLETERFHPCITTPKTP